MDVREALMDVVRTVLKGVGGALVADGVITSDQNVALAGAAALAFGLIWSWVSTYWFSKTDPNRFEPLA